MSDDGFFRWDGSQAPLTVTDALLVFQQQQHKQPKRQQQGTTHSNRVHVYSHTHTHTAQSVNTKKCWYMRSGTLHTHLALSLSLGVVHLVSSRFSLSRSRASFSSFSLLPPLAEMRGLSLCRQCRWFKCFRFSNTRTFVRWTSYSFRWVICRSCATRFENINRVKPNP